MKKIILCLIILSVYAFSSSIVRTNRGYEKDMGGFWVPDNDGSKESLEREKMIIDRHKKYCETNAYPSIDDCGVVIQHAIFADDTDTEIKYCEISCNNKRGADVFVRCAIAGELYLNIKNNKTKAKEYFKKACDGGFKKACRHLNPKDSLYIK